MAVCGGGAKPTSGSTKVGWGKIKLGQMIVLDDLTNAIRKLGQDEDDLVRFSFGLCDASHVGSRPDGRSILQVEQDVAERSQFFEALEARMAVLIEARVSPSMPDFSTAKY